MPPEAGAAAEHMAGGISASGHLRRQRPIGAQEARCSESGRVWGMRSLPAQIVSVPESPEWPVIYGCLLASCLNALPRQSALPRSQPYTCARPTRSTPTLPNLTPSSICNPLCNPPVPQVAVLVQHVAAAQHVQRGEGVKQAAWRAHCAACCPACRTACYAASLACRHHCQRGGLHVSLQDGGQRCVEAWLASSTGQVSSSKQSCMARNELFDMEAGSAAESTAHKRAETRVPPGKLQHGP